MSVKVLAFAGSTRSNSYNKQLIAIAASAAREAGADVTTIDLRDYPMPLFDEDLEAESGMDEYAGKFKKLLAQADGVLISSPEYNSGYSAVLKNAIDWASRSESEDPHPLIAFRGKYVALLSASPGNLGGMRGLVVLRMLLGNLGMFVLPTQVALPNAGAAFDENKNLIDSKKQTAVEKLSTDLVRTLQKLV